MKIKNGIIKIIIATMVISIGLGTTLSLAATRDLKLSYFRYNIKHTDTGFEYELANGYALNTTGNEGESNHPIYQVLAVNGTQKDGINLYCLNATAGETWNSPSAGTAAAVTYEPGYNLVTQKSAIETMTNSVYSNVANSDYYKQIMWILDNIYIPQTELTDAQNMANKKALLAKAGIVYGSVDTGSGVNGYKYSAISGYDYSNFVSNVGKQGYQYKDADGNIKNVTLADYDDLILAVQQAVLWYYTNYKDTNNNPGNTNTTYNAYLSRSATTVINWLQTSNGASSTDTMNWPLLSQAITDTSIFTDPVTGAHVQVDPTPGAMLQEQATILYDYLVDAADNYASSHDEYVNTATPLSLASNVANIKEITLSGTQYYVVGPITINKTGDNYNLDTILVNNSSSTGAYISDTNGTDINTTLNNVVGNPFYITVPKSQVTTNPVNIKFTGTATTNVKTLWTNPTKTEQPIVEVTPSDEPINLLLTATIEDTKTFDLALRKAISKVTNSAGTDKIIANEAGRVATRNLQYVATDIATNKTATYKHRKDPVVVEKGDVVTYSISVYNEGDEAGYATTIVDKLPQGLALKEYITNNTTTGRMTGTTIIPVQEGYDGGILSAEYTYVYNPTTNEITFTNASKNPLSAYGTVRNDMLSREIIEIECKVVQEPSSTTNTYLTNIAYISSEHNSDKNIDITNQTGADRDSRPVDYPTPTQVTTGNTYRGYKGNNTNQSVYDDTNNSYYYKGDQDDDDFEIVVIKPAAFDLALQKYISSITSNGVTKAGRQAPTINTTNLANKTATTATYTQDKTAIKVKNGDYVTYTLRVYNEGEKAGFVNKITDNIPSGLQFVYQKDNDGKTLVVVNSDGTSSEIEVDSATYALVANNSYWSIDQNSGVIAKDTYNGESTISVTCDVEEYLPTTGLGTYNAGNFLDAYDSNSDVNNNGAGLSYIDVKVVLKVSEPNSSNRTIRNEAAITEAEDTDGNKQDTGSLRDRDSQINEWPGKDGEKRYQDDEDYDNIKLAQVDLALTKFITAVSEDALIQNGEYLTKDKTSTNAGTTSNPYDRQTEVNTTPLKNETATDAIYTQVKTPLLVPEEAYVLYNIRVYNEGDVDVYAGEVTDYLPNYLDFVSGEFNDNYGWHVESDGKTVKTSYLSHTNGTNKILKAFDRITDDGKGSKLDYKDLPILCKVNRQAPDKTNLVNTAEITKYEDENGNTITEDVDSTPKNVPDTNKNKEQRKEDDDDYEVIYIKKPTVDLALTKFITAVSKDALIENGEYLTKDKTSTNAGTTSNPYDRQTEVNTTPLKNGTATDAIYTQVKTPLEVSAKAYVLYNIRVYNEGEVDVYAGEVTDYLPNYLDFVSGEFNNSYGWTANGKEVKTSYLSHTNGTDKILKAFDKENDNGAGSKLDYKDLPILCKLNDEAPTETNLVNTAEITKYEDKNGDTISKDVDSTPKNVPDTDKNKEQRKEDDDDYEVIYIKKPTVDLALTKFITAVSKDIKIEDGEYLTKDTTSKNAGTTSNPYTRATKVDTTKLRDDKDCHDATYTIVKTPLTVSQGDYVLYNIRVYNEGQVDAYAGEVADYLPEYLDFVSGEFNDNYKWKVGSDGKTVKSTYLSSENGTDKILKAFDKRNDNGAASGLDYKDLPILCKVNNETPTNKKMVNSAEITKYEDENGEEVEEDIDSKPENIEKKNEEENYEDDDDYEVVIVKTFDLSLLKYVSTVYVTEDGKTTTTQTGNVGDSNDKIPKVEIHRKKLNSTVVKFGYTIKITNEGDIAGYAKEITDYVPEGLKFYKEDNTGWTDEGNNVISTKLLENKLLQPGESATVTVIFRWINGSSNLGLKTNTAEISEDYNEEGVPDRDSTPDNKKAGEDDIDTADVLLSISTGLADNLIQYVTYGTIILAVLGTGLFLIRKFVL